MVQLANPLADTSPAMRTTLLPGLFAAVARNRSRSQDDLALYEQGLVFFGPVGVAPVPGVDRRPSAAELAEIAEAWRRIAMVEAEHERRYRILLERVSEEKVFERDAPIDWQCRNCGYVHHGKEAPDLCPACQHPQAYYEPKKENY